MVPATPANVEEQPPISGDDDALSTRILSLRHTGSREPAASLQCRGPMIHGAPGVVTCAGSHGTGMAARPRRRQAVGQPLVTGAGRWTRKVVVLFVSDLEPIRAITRCWPWRASE